MFPDIYLVCRPSILHLLQVNIAQVKVNKLVSVKLEPINSLDRLETIKLELEPEVLDPSLTSDMGNDSEHDLSKVKQPSNDYINHGQSHAESSKRKRVGRPPKKPRGRPPKANKPLTETVSKEENPPVKNVFKTFQHSYVTGDSSLKTTEGSSVTENLKSVENPQSPVENLPNSAISSQNGLRPLRGRKVLKLAEEMDLDSEKDEEDYDEMEDQQNESNESDDDSSDGSTDEWMPVIVSTDKHNFDISLVMRDNPEQPSKHIKCDECDTMFSFDRGLKKHKRRYHQTPQFPCDLCDKRFAEVTQYHLHKFTVHRPEPVIRTAAIKCHYCDLGISLSYLF